MDPSSADAERDEAGMLEPLELSHSVVDHWEKNCATPDKVDEKIADLERLILHYTEKSAFSDIRSDLIERFTAIVANCETEPPRLKQKELELMKIFARDRNRLDLDCFGQLAIALFKLAGLPADGSSSTDSPKNKEVLLEAEKCLINILFNSTHARSQFIAGPIAALPSRISCILKKLNDSAESTTYLSEFTVEDIANLLYFDLKIAFITSAKETAVQKAWLDDSDGGVKVFLDALKQAVGEFTHDFTQPPLHRANETLQVLFNLYCHAKIYDVGVSEKCAEECVRLIENRKLLFELHQNAVHLLSLVSCKEMEKYCPELSKESIDPCLINEGRDMRFVKALLDVFERGLAENSSTQPRLLGTYLTLLINLCTQVKAARRYCRMHILPPLTASDVQRPPEEGDDLRNKLVRLIRENSGVQELSAELLFVLCKRSVNRLVKYTGLGHSAGLLANYGFLAQAMGMRGKKSASDSEDSETEEYKEVEGKINPVTGYIPPVEQAEASQRLLDSMSDEQKEYEAMKLANAMSKLMDAGVFTPARVDEQGRPQPVEHVLELLKDTEAKSSHKKKGDESDSE